jgi:multimeric flavodoxin WrbA
VDRAFSSANCKGDIVRVVDLNIMPGVTSNEGRGDDWPKLRRRILEADILIVGTPIWMGQPSSVAKRICERMDAFFDELDDRQRMPSYNKVAAVAVVGNEDGAHHVSAELDLKRTPKAVKKATDMLVSNTVHMARLLKARPFPGLDKG